MSKLVKGQAYLLNDGGNWCRRFVRYADDGDNLIMADSNGTESIWDCTCLVRKLSDDEVSGWSKSHRTDSETELAQHKQVIAELVDALERAQKTLAMLTDDNSIKTTTVSFAYAQVVDAELVTRTAIARAKALRE